MKNEIKEFISSVDWQFAKTMPACPAEASIYFKKRNNNLLIKEIGRRREIPHEYIVTNRYPNKIEQIRDFIDEIEKNGYTKEFYGKQYKYLEIDGYKYWVIENIINREKITK